MTVMQNVARDLMNLGRTGLSFRRVTQPQFREWQQHYTWHGVQGISYGRSFCDHFGIWDNILYSLKTVSVADQYIRLHYLHASRQDS